LLSLLQQLVIFTAGGVRKATPQVATDIDVKNVQIKIENVKKRNKNFFKTLVNVIEKVRLTSS